MTKSLVDLPPELLSQIFSHLDKNGWLLDLGLCRRSFYSLVLPRLHKRVNLKHTLVKGHRHLKSFTSHILKSPHLGFYVQELTLESSPFPGEDHKIETAWDFREMPDNLHGIVASLSTSDEDKDAWLDSLREETNEDAWLSLLIQHLPNLLRLDIHVPPGSKTRFRTMIDNALSTENLYGGKRPFPSLKAGALTSGWSGFTSDVLDFIVQVLKLPSLCDLDGRSIFGYGLLGEVPSLAKLETDSLPLTRLELRNSRVHPRHLSHIFRACKSLRTFVYNAAIFDDDLPQYHTAMKYIEGSLETLRFDCEEVRGLHGFPPATPEGFPSLASFRALKYLETDMFIFLGTMGASDVSDTSPEVLQALSSLPRFFPPSIETISFTTKRGNPLMLMRALVYLLRKRASFTPRLRSIAIENHEGVCAGCDIADLIALGIKPRIETRWALPPPEARGACQFSWIKFPYPWLELSCCPPQE